MITPTKRHITVPEGSTWSFSFIWRVRRDNAEGEPVTLAGDLADPEDPETWVWDPVDLTGCTYHVQIRTDFADAVGSEMVLDVPQNRFVLSTAYGLPCKVTMTLTPADTAFDPDFDSGKWEFKIKFPDGSIAPVWKGNMRVGREVSVVA